MRPDRGANIKAWVAMLSHVLYNVVTRSAAERVYIVNAIVGIRNMMYDYCTTTELLVIRYHMI